MNNSGNTETFKYQGYASQLIPGAQSDSYRTPDALTSGATSVAIGKNAKASHNVSSTAIGANSTASGDNSFAAGNSTASGQGAFAGPEGNAQGNRSFAHGAAQASGPNSFAMGFLVYSTANASFAFGAFTTANADNSTAFGRSKAYNIGQFSKSGGYVDAVGDFQQIMINSSKSASIASTGTSILSTNSNDGAVDIDLDGNNRLYKVKCLWGAFVKTSGGGGSDPAVGSAFAQELNFTFKKVGGTLTQVGSTTTGSTENDASMAGCLLIPSVASNKLRLTFTAPVTTGNNTYKINAGLYITDIAY